MAPYGYKRQELTILKKYQTHVKVNTRVGFVILDHSSKCLKTPLFLYCSFTVFYLLLRTLCMNMPTIAIVLNWRKQTNTSGLKIIGFVKWPKQ